MRFSSVSQRLVMAREMVQMLLPKPRRAESRVPDCPVGADAIHCGINPVQQGAIMELSELIAHYTDAWNQPDRARREQLLELVWDEQGTYTDPLGFVAGRGAFVDHIGAFIQQYPGSRLERTSEIDAHDRYFRFNWRMLKADGTLFVEGVDFGELSPSGQLQRLVGFFGALAAKGRAG